MLYIYFKRPNETLTKIPNTITLKTMELPESKLVFKVIEDIDLTPDNIYTVYLLRESFNPLTILLCNIFANPARNYMIYWMPELIEYWDFIVQLALTHTIKILITNWVNLPSDFHAFLPTVNKSVNTLKDFNKEFAAYLMSGKRVFGQR